VKNVVGSSRKRKVISLRESEYDVDEVSLYIFPSAVKKSAGKKSVQIVENVPVDKVSFHFSDYA